MGFWHTGYMEFHEPVGLGEAIAAHAAPVFRCDFCSEAFGTFELLRVHRFEKHPAIRPVLFVRGREVGGTPLRLTRSINPSDVQVLHASSATLNGRSLAVTDLGAHLAPMSAHVADIRLDGEVKAEFKLQFEIATDQDVAGVEKCFENAAHRGRLDRRAIEDFIESARGFPTAMAYCDGICEYLYGALAKERSTESSLAFHEYRDKFNRAADILRDVHRPLARLVQGLVAFHFNHFGVAAVCSPSTRVASASERFLGWVGLRRPPGWPASETSPTMDRLLTDLDTEHVLRWTLGPPAETLAQSRELEAAVERDIPEFDRVKLRVLLAELYLHSERRADAHRHARELRNNPSLGRWAESVLAETREGLRS